MRKIDAEAETITLLFSSERFFRVPYYQRPFSWGSDEFIDLITDLTDAQGDEEYFLGTIVLHEKTEENLLDIVDGQQRITSILIMLACFRDLITDDNYSNQIQNKLYQKENPLDKLPEKSRLESLDTLVFPEIIKNSGSTVTIADSENQSTFAEAIRIFRSKIINLDQTELQDLSSFIVGNCKVIRLQTDDFTDAFRMFEIVNDRGRQLRRIDILKSRNLSPKSIGSESKKSNFAIRWQEYEDAFGSDEFEQFFYTLRLALTKEKSTKDLATDFENKIQKNKIIPHGEAFFEKTFFYADLYKSLFIDFDFSLGENSVDQNKFSALITAMSGEFNSSEWKSCLLLFAEHHGHDGFMEFIYEIEKLYTHHALNGVRKDERFNDYIELLKVVEISNSVNVAEKFSITDKSLIEGLCQVDFYKTKISKYILVKLELLELEHDRIHAISAKSVEHIFPQNPKPESTWLTKCAEREPAEFVNKLGNLVLLSKSKNSSASNKEFDDKKKTYLEPKMSDYPRSLKIASFSEWGPDQIDTVTNELALKALHKL